MTDETAFVAAIQAAPDDLALRLVYADWLEEQGDPRAKLIRVEEEMRQLPVFTDRYWELKPRRDEDRRHAAVEWLQAMRYGTDYQPTLRHGVPDGWKERWRLAREFLERWHQHPLPDVGGRVEEIRQVEAQFGRTLPPSVREWVAFAHDVYDGECQLQELPALAVVSLLLAPEGDYHWAVRHADLTVPDPPVYGFHWDFENHDESTFVPVSENPVAPTVSSFALRDALRHHTKAGGFTTDVAEPARLLRDLE